MTRIGETNGTINPSVPCIEIMGACVVGGGISVGDNSIAWQETCLCTPDFDYVLDTEYYLTNTGVIIVNTTGMYLMDYSLCLFSYWGSATEVELFIKVNDIEINAAHSIKAINKHTTINVSKPIYLKKDDKITFWLSSNVDHEDLYIADSLYENIKYYSYARVSYIPMGGWNNGKGGNVINRGIRR